ncbi:uncharacterized protein LOC125026394 [Penaeus chinensis]|uniref:uncharacterized protein LOC125026394 n=1 Tax=Penaeus chinensis TaxID=139456 RepID=UPI001FB77DC2|nr:uncharacterized protein LOC125026394 [Penaeus chinensis]
MNPELKEWVKKNSSVVRSEENFTIYEVKTKKKHEDLQNKVRVLTVGPENDLETKTVLLLGETGVGKTTFLNTFLNMVFGVGLEDELRLQFKDQMDQAKDSTQSQTEYTTAFTIYRQEGMPQPFNYMVIDTPGLGDTEGDQKDKVNEKCLRFYLTNEAWIKHLNCVGLVWKASNQKLDGRNREILSSINKLLGFDIRSMTDILLTFSTFDESSATQVIHESGIKYTEVFHFDNVPIYQCPKQKEKKKLHAFIWESMVDNFDKFFNKLNQRQPQELKITARLLLAQAKLEDTQMRLNAIDQSSSLMSDQLQSRQAKMNDLEVMATKVDWDKIQELDTSSEEIVLDDGRHCHYCKQCRKMCIPSCTDDHGTAMCSSDMQCSPMETDEEQPDYGDMVLDTADTIRTQSQALAVTGQGLISSIAAVMSEIASAVVQIGRLILGAIKSVRSEGKTQTLHSNEGSQRCPVCQHMVLKHEIRNKILAKDANFEQKMELLKKKKFMEVTGEKNFLQSEIDAVQEQLSEFERRREDELRVLQEKQKEVEKLQTGQ